MFAALNQACLSAFAEPFVYIGAGGDVPMQGIFDRERDDGGVLDDGLHNLLFVAETTVTEHGIAQRQTVRVRGIDYQILAVTADVGGMAKLTLRRYA